MEKIISGKTINVNEEGYLTGFSQWDKTIATEIAKEEGITELGPRHWQIIDYLQDQHKKEIPLSIRKIGKSGVMDIEEFYAAFQPRTLKKASASACLSTPASFN